MLLHFALPFLLLLSRDVKRVRKQLAFVAGRVFTDAFLGTLLGGGPRTPGPGVLVHWIDVAAWAAVGGTWVWFFTQQLKNRPMLPVGEPEIRELLERAR